MNARRAANHSPSKCADLILDDEGYMFRWSGADGTLLMFQGWNPEDTKLVGQISPDEADSVLNMTGWKPVVPTSRLHDLFWEVAYFVGCRLHLRGFHKTPPPEPDKLPHDE